MFLGVENEKCCLYVLFDLKLGLLMFSEVIIISVTV
jgi:hypothetical protein